MITAILPIPPSLNGMYATVRGRRRIKTKEARRYARDAAWAIKIAAGKIRIQGPWAIDVVLPKSMKGDPDNRLKILLDSAVASGVVIDDRFCHGITVTRTGETSEAVITLRAADG